MPVKKFTPRLYCCYLIAGSPDYPILCFRERNPPSNIIPCSTFRAQENDSVDLPRGFDGRRIFTGIQLEKCRMEPELMPALRAYPEFIINFDIFNFMKFRHDTIPWEQLSSGHCINVARVLQPIV
jgi:hypothetical protein